MAKPFKIYRIVCTVTERALVHGSDKPTWSHPTGRKMPWYCRGGWSSTAGAFWKTENAVRKHLQNLCHDWVTKSAPARYPRYPNQHVYWTEAVPGPADWSRLRYLRVEQIYVTNYATTVLEASDFMGVPVETAKALGEGQ